MHTATLFIDCIETLGMPTLQLVGDLDLLTCSALSHRLRELLRRGHVCVGLDLRNIRFIDSEGALTIVAACEEWRRLCRELIVVDASAGVRKVFSLLDLENLLKWVTSPLRPFQAGTVK